MQIYNVEQGTPEWEDLRLGIPTTSCFSKIVTPTGKLSTQSAEYQNELLAEVFCSDESEFQGNYWTDRGNEYEPQAVANYEFQYDVKTEKVGFITETVGVGMVGCSPDRLVGNYGLLEIKCPGAKKHLSNLFSNELDKQYRPQVQGQIWLSGRK